VKPSRQGKKDGNNSSAFARKKKRQLAIHVQDVREKAFERIMKEISSQKLDGLKDLDKQGADAKTKLQGAKKRAADQRARQHALDEKIDSLASRFVTHGEFSHGKTKDEAALRYTSEAAELMALASEGHRTYE
jgi:hypothetical protein